MNLPTLIGLGGISLLLSATLFKILISLKISKQTAYILSGLIFILSFVPISGYTVNQYFRGLFNDLSITSIIVLGYYLINPERSKNQTQPLMLLIAIVGILFYPAAIGFGPIDPYAWGYLNQDHGLFIPLLFLALLAALMTMAVIKRYTLLLSCLVFSSIAYQLNLLESLNLWDYLLDPIIFLYAIITIIARRLWALFSVKKPI